MDVQNSAAGVLHGGADPGVALWQANSSYGSQSKDGFDSIVTTS